MLSDTIANVSSSSFTEATQSNYVVVNNNGETAGKIVNNKLCQIIVQVRVTTPSSSWVEVGNGIPTPKMTLNAAPMIDVGSTSSTDQAQMLVQAGRVYVRNGTAGKTYTGAVTYISQ